jgi:hypothetical protein
MIVTFGYFAKPFASDVVPRNLSIVNGDFATRPQAVAHARATADQLGAHSLTIDFPDGTTEWQVRDGAGWKQREP